VLLDPRTLTDAEADLAAAAAAAVARGVVSAGDEPLTLGTAGHIDTARRRWSAP
jgi:hypothetical protein